MPLSLPHPTILLCGAFWPEIDLLHRAYHKKKLSLEFLSKFSPRPFHKKKTLFSPRIYSEVLELGIGPIEPALSLQRRILEIEGKRRNSFFRFRTCIQEIVFFGSAGLYEVPEASYSYGPLCYAQSSDFYFHDLSVLEGKAKQPELLCTHVQSKAGPLALLLSKNLQRQNNIKFFPYLSTNTTPSLSLQKPAFSLRKNKGKAFFQLENLEVFALAQLAAYHKLAFSAFFALSNQVGPQASEEWQKNHRVMSIVLQEEIKKTLASL